MNHVIRKALIGFGAMQLVWGAFGFPVVSAWGNGSDGKRIYIEHCLSCHGVHGDGKGPKARGLFPPPSDFTTPSFWQDKTETYLFHVVQNGMGPMPGWSDSMSPQNIEDVLLYLKTFKK